MKALGPRCWLAVPFVPLPLRVGRQYSSGLHILGLETGAAFQDPTPFFQSEFPYLGPSGGKLGALQFVLNILAPLMLDKAT